MVRREDYGIRRKTFRYRGTNKSEISGIGETILYGILAEMGDISKFDDVKEIQ